MCAYGSSGDPTTVVLQVARILAKRFGTTTNRKGYQVLNNVRIIQGDGINQASIQSILEALEAAGFAADNVAFGMGGALLQGINRDTLQFAMKCSAIRIKGEWFDVYKDPITDSGKTSKRGRLTLWQNTETGDYLSPRQTPPPTPWQEALTPVWDTGKLLKDWTFAEVRARAAGKLPYAHIPMD